MLGLPRGSESVSYTHLAETVEDVINAALEKPKPEKKQASKPDKKKIKTIKVRCV